MSIEYTQEEHDKCKRVAEAFNELYDIYGDMCVVDAGKYGFVHLKWFRGYGFDGNKAYTDSKKLFDDLWEFWLNFMVFDPEKGTDLCELSYEELYAMQTEEKIAEFEKKRREFLKAAGMEEAIDENIK